MKKKAVLFCHLLVGLQQVLPCEVGESPPPFAPAAIPLPAVLVGAVHLLFRSNAIPSQQISVTRKPNRQIISSYQDSIQACSLPYIFLQPLSTDRITTALPVWLGIVIYSCV